MRLNHLLRKIASGAPAPASGSAAAAAVAAAAALVQKVATLSGKQWSEAAAAHDRAEQLRLRSEELVEEDSLAYLAFLDAARSGQDLDSARNRTIDVPLEIVRTAAEVARLAHLLGEKGNQNLRVDASVASILATAAAESAALLVKANLPRESRDARLREARRLAREAKALGSLTASADSPRRAR